MIAFKISQWIWSLASKIATMKSPNAKQEFRTQSLRLLKVGLHSGWSRRDNELGSKWSFIFVNIFTWAMLWILFGIFRNLFNFPPPAFLHVYFEETLNVVGSGDWKLVKNCSLWVLDGPFHILLAVFSIFFKSKHRFLSRTMIFVSAIQIFPPFGLPNAVFSSELILFSSVL